MLKVYLALLFLATVFAESVRETETWVPEKIADVDTESSSDFRFTGDGDDDDDDTVVYEESGSGDEADLTPVTESEINNSIPDDPVWTQSWPTSDDLETVGENEVMPPSSVQRNKAEQNIFNKTEVLAAVIAGGAVGLLFAILLILLLIYRMKKKDEGSYDLGKKPIYKKAPTTEIYA